MAVKDPTHRKMLEDLDILQYRMSREDKSAFVKVRNLAEANDLCDDDLDRMADLHDFYC